MSVVRHADLPLHYGKVPDWLYKRMGLLGGAIIEAVAQEYGRSAVVSRLSDPFWFQALGCVLGMDWHSSGITTSVMGALKGAINPKYRELGIYICGGKGKQSTQTPAELLVFSDKTGLDGKELVKSSKLTAKVDNTAIQDGYQIYLHNFIVTCDGEWAVVQQGMNDGNGMARRYHWHSAQVKSFVEEPHTFIYGHNQGQILNLTDAFASPTKTAMLELTKERPVDVLTEVRKVVMPRHHEVQAKDVDLKRLGSVLTLAHNTDLKSFEELLMLEGVGPRTIQSLALVSEVIHGTPSRFTDPARYTFAHGGKDGHPFPVPLKVYDETIQVLKTSVEKAKMGNTDKQQALRSLTKVAQQLEKDFTPDEGAFEKVIAHERNNSYKYGGRTVMGFAKAPQGQLTLL